MSLLEIAKLLVYTRCIPFSSTRSELGRADESKTIDSKKAGQRPCEGEKRARWHGLRAIRNFNYLPNTILQSVRARSKPAVTPCLLGAPCIPTPIQIWHPPLDAARAAAPC